MRTATGIINQHIEIYADQDIKNSSGGVIPNSSLYWATVAEVKPIEARRDLSQAQEIFKPAFTFTISDRNDKNVRPNMLLKWRGSWFTITNCVPDYVYVQMLNITAITSDPPIRDESLTAVLEWFYADTDYHGDELSIPEFQFSKAINGIVTELEMDLTTASSGHYIGFRVPTGFEPTFTNWELNDENSGPIPGFNWYAKETTGDHDYYLSRTLFFLNEGSTILTVTS